MCTINFSQTLLANQNTGKNTEMSSFALSEAQNGMAVVSFNFFVAQNVSTYKMLYSELTL